MWNEEIQKVRFPRCRKDARLPLALLTDTFPVSQAMFALYNLTVA